MPRLCRRAGGLTRRFSARPSGSQHNPLRFVACRDDAAIVSSTDFPYEKSLVGMHGSLTDAEMLIPILVG